MEPSLVYVSTETGELLGKYQLPDSQLSIRHLDVNSNGLVASTTQHQGKDSHYVPLLAAHAGENELQFFTDESSNWGNMKNYCGSVAFTLNAEQPLSTGQENIAAVTSPRGDRIKLFDFVRRIQIADFKAQDIYGVGYSKKLKLFIATSGRGVIYQIDL